MILFLQVPRPHPHQDTTAQPAQISLLASRWPPPTLGVLTASPFRHLFQSFGHRRARSGRIG